MTINRRDFHKISAALFTSIMASGVTSVSSFAEAQKAQSRYYVLTAEEGELLSLLGDAIVPGAKHAGLSHFIDQQLAAGSHDSLLIGRYLGLQENPLGFYREGLRAFRQSFLLAVGKEPKGASKEELRAYIKAMGQGNPEGWVDAAAAPFFYFVLRSDAVDVTYGTMAGFETLDIPYMAHIEPPAESWQ